MPCLQRPLHQISSLASWALDILKQAVNLYTVYLAEQLPPWTYSLVLPRPFTANPTTSVCHHKNVAEIQALAD